VLQRRPNTFAQANLSPSFFACDKAADHTFLFARQPSRTGDERLWTALFVPLPRFCNHECGRRSYGTHSELQGCDKISTVTRARDFSALRF